MSAVTPENREAMVDRALGPRHAATLRNGILVRNADDALQAAATYRIVEIIEEGVGDEAERCSAIARHCMALMSPSAGHRRTLEGFATGFGTHRALSLAGA